MQLTKSTVGTWLFISLIPAGLLGFIAFVMFAFSGGGDPEADPFAESWPTFWWATVVLLWPYFWIGLGVGIVLKVWAGFETRRLYREARQYAEMHSWQQISDTAWKNFRRNNWTLSVNQAYGKTTYILTVDSDGETAATDGFSQSLYALQFGDFLWETVLSVRSQVDVQTVRETRDVWERSRALAPGR